MGSPRTFSFEKGARQLHLTERDAEDLERLLRLLGRSAAAGDRNVLRALARRIHLARSMRSNYLPRRMFGEPGWDMLLALYGGLGDGAASIDCLSEAAHAPISAALRWIDYLEVEGLIVREQGPAGPVIWLTDAGGEAVETYLTELCGEVP